MSRISFDDEHTSVLRISSTMNIWWTLFLTHRIIYLKRKRLMLLCSCLIWLHTPPPRYLASTGHTERRKSQREVRMVNLTAVTAERGRALEAK